MERTKSSFQHDRQIDAGRCDTALSRRREQPDQHHTLLRKLQSVQNATARLITGTQ